MKSYPIVEVLWDDAVQLTVDGEWLDLSTVPNRPAKSRTVGYLIHETAKAVTVIGLYNDQGHAGLGITIPAGMVTTIRRLT